MPYRGSNERRRKMYEQFNSATFARIRRPLPTICRYLTFSALLDARARVRALASSAVQLPARGVTELDGSRGPVVDIANLVSLAGALGLGSVLGQFLMAGGQRRQTRAEVLRALGDVESSRWAGDEKPAMPFSVAMRELDTAALLARVPREAVVHYKLLAQAGFWASVESWEQYPDPEFGGGIETDLATIIREAAAEISSLVWRPWVGRVGLRRRIRVREARVGAIENQEVARQLKRSREHPPA